MAPTISSGGHGLGGDSTLRRKAWTVALSGTGINLALGILYTYSIFKASIKGSELYGWEDASLNVPYSVCCLVFAFAMILGGRVQDRYGPRITAFIGGVLVALGFVLISFTTSLTMWIVGFGVLAGTGIGFGYSSATPPGLKWFPPSKTGLVAGIVVSGFGLASVYIAPLANWLLSFWSLQTTMLFFGVAFAVVLSLLSLNLVNPKAGYNASSAFGESGAPTSAAIAAAPDHDAGPAEILRSWRFWRMWIMYAVGSGAGLMVISDVLGMAKQSMAESAFIAVALFAVGNAAGRIVAGVISDRIGRRMTLRIMLAFQALLMLACVPTVVNSQVGAVALVVVATIIGFNYGTNLSLFPALAKDAWGLKHFGSNYGLLFTSWGVGGFLLSEMYQRMKAADQQAAAFVVVAVLLLIAAAFTLAIPRKRAAAA